MMSDWWLFRRQLNDNCGLKVSSTFFTCVFSSPTSKTLIHGSDPAPPFPPSLYTLAWSNTQLILQTLTVKTSCQHAGLPCRHQGELEHSSSLFCTTTILQKVRNLSMGVWFYLECLMMSHAPQINTSSTAQQTAVRPCLWAWRELTRGYWWWVSPIWVDGWQTGVMITRELSRWTPWWDDAPLLLTLLSTVVCERERSSPRGTASGSHRSERIGDRLGWKHRLTVVAVDTPNTVVVVCWHCFILLLLLTRLNTDVVVVDTPKFCCWWHS